jgi:hypothetical protein
MGRWLPSDTGFDIHHPHVPLPHVQGVANVEKLLLAVQFQFVQALSHLKAYAVKPQQDTVSRAPLPPASS